MVNDTLFSRSYLCHLFTTSAFARLLAALEDRLTAWWSGVGPRLLALWQGSAAGRLMAWLFSACARLWAGCGLAAFFYREGWFARRWRESGLCALVSWVANIPAALLHLLYRAKPALWEGSAFAQLGYAMGDAVPFWAGLGLFAILCVPYELWDNACSLLLALALLLLFYAAGMRRREARLDAAAMGPYAFLYWGAVLVSVVFSNYRSLSLRFLLYHIPCFLLVFVIVSAVRSSRQLVQMALGLGGGVLVSSLYAFYQRLVLHITVNPSYVDMSINAGMPGRVYSFFENPNSYAELLLLLLPLLVALFFIFRRLSAKIAALLVFGIGAAAIVMTYSRASWVGLVVAALVYIFLWDRRFLPLCLVVGLCAVPLLPSTVLNRILTITNTSDSSTSSRFPLYNAGARMIARQPLMGVGLGIDAVQARVTELNYYDAAIPFVHTHNTFLQVWLETGLLGLVSLLGHVLWTVKSAARAVRTSTDTAARHIAIGGASALCGAMVCGLADYLWNYPRVMFIFWAVAGMTVAAVKLCLTGTDG